MNTFWSIRTEKLVDDLSQQVAYLKNLLISNQDLVEEHFSKASVADSVAAEINTMDSAANVKSSKDRNCHSSSSAQVNNSLSLEEDENGPAQTVQKECMSVDISEYELQMQEMQARQEENDEQSILAFEVRIFRVSVVICVVQFKRLSFFLLFKRRPN